MNDLSIDLRLAGHAGVLYVHAARSYPYVSLSTGASILNIDPEGLPALIDALIKACNALGPDSVKCLVPDVSEAQS